MKKTKKNLLNLLAVLSVLGGSLGLAACDGLQVLEYALLKDGTYEVVNCFGGATQIVIPSSYKGKAVTSIGEGGLNNCSSLTSIVIPVSIENIGAYALSGCNSLTTIYYTGTEEEWNYIFYKYDLYDIIPSKATIICNYVPK